MRFVAFKITAGQTHPTFVYALQVLCGEPHVQMEVFHFGIGIDRLLL
jgi:hypothetical protein